MTSDFNIRDRDWDPEFSFHSVYNDLLFDIADVFDLSSSHPTNPCTTRYLDNGNNSNSVIDLMFLRPNFSELDNHFILSDL